MNLHFVCTGNVFRSRLAEAYARYLLKNHPQYHITSSGVRASDAENGPIAWYALKIIAQNGLLPYLAPTWTQTTFDILISQNLTIFMQSWHHQQCQIHFNYQSPDYQLWDIADILPDMGDDEIIPFSEQQFQNIKTQVGALINNLVAR